MRLPITTYGNQILRQKCIDISDDYEDLDILIENMWETMTFENGCGLAAPQIGESIKLFIVDSKSSFETMDAYDRKKLFDSSDMGIQETFINAKVINYSDKFWEEEEGCLSIPDMHFPVTRPWSLTIEYFNRDFIKQVKTFKGYTARVIMHEYDHTEGKLYIDHINPLTRKLIEKKLKRHAKGEEG